MSPGRRSTREEARAEPGPRLSGKTALVTGAASGIGRAVAELFAREGARVAVTDLDEVGAARVADGIRAEGGIASSRTLDVRQESAWDAAVAGVVDDWAGLDVLVANAGVSHARSLADTPLEEWREVHAVNLEGVFLGIRAAVRAMTERGSGGSIVIVSSASGLKAAAGAAAYCTSKAAVRMLARVAALECAGDGIRVNVVCPSGVVTPMWERMSFFQDLRRERGEAGAWRALAADTPLGRFASPDEVARAILYLASDDAAYVTGTDLVLDGGYTA